MRPRFLEIDTCLFLAAGALLVATSVASAHGATRFENGLWYRDGGFVPETWVAVEGELRRDWEGEAEVVDLDGGFVVPAYGDAHRHGFTGDAFAADNEASLRAGVFWIGNPNSLVSRTGPVRKVVARPETVDVRYSHGGLTGPGGHPRPIYDRMADQWGVAPADLEGDAYHEIEDLADLEATWPTILAAGPDFVKVMLERSEHHAVRRDDPAWYGRRGLDPALVPEVVERAHAAGLRVSVHATSRADVAVAIASGADELAHLPLDRLGPEEAAAAASAGITVVTTTVSHRPYDGDEDLDAVHRANLALLRDHGVALVLGTDSGATVVDEARNLARLGAFTPAELLELISVRTPEWIFPERDLGRLEEGGEASFLVLDADPTRDVAALSRIRTRVKAGHVLDLPELEELPGIGQALVHLIMAQGIEPALAEYHRRRAEEADQWDFSEGQLNALGYALIEHGRLDLAIPVFELNTQVYPEAANPWDSLGEAYRRQGDEASAIKYYRRSLELNPHNEGARAALREMGADG